MSRNNYHSNFSDQFIHDVKQRKWIYGANISNIPRAISETWPFRGEWGRSVSYLGTCRGKYIRGSLRRPPGGRFPCAGPFPPWNGGKRRRNEGHVGEIEESISQCYRRYAKILGIWAIYGWRMHQRGCFRIRILNVCSAIWRKSTTTFPQNISKSSGGI